VLCERKCHSGRSSFRRGKVTADFTNYLNSDILHPLDGEDPLARQVGTYPNALDNLGRDRTAFGYALGDIFHVCRQIMKYSIFAF